MNRRALVIGAGIAGMQAALDIAGSGYEVVLVDRLPSIGGHMAQLSETFPTLDCSQCILTPRTVEVGHHENIRLYTYSEVEAIEGQVGDYLVRIRRHASYVDWDLCTGCGTCQEKCPERVPSEFDRLVGERTAIYIVSPQAVPNKPIIDAEHCRYLTSKADIESGKVPALSKSGKPSRPKCGICAKVCPTQAIRFEQGDTSLEERFGAIVLATGYDLISQSLLPEYGGGLLPDVIDGLAFERLLSASGPTSGKVLRPSDHTEPKDVVFVQCSGSRDPERGVPYCSKVCCMYTAKHAMLYKHNVPDGRATVFYIDIRAGGKGYEEFVSRASEEDGVVYRRGKVSKIVRQNGRLLVWGADTLSGERIELDADMVVLATAVVPSAGSQQIASMLGLQDDETGFYVPRDSELMPVQSTRSGVFLAGAGLGPRDIPETVAQASGAAGQVLKLFSAKSDDCAD